MSIPQKGGLPDHYNSLDQISVYAWRRLEQAVRDKSDALNLGHLATRTLSGRPDCRSLILRNANQEAGTVTFHTDSRSSKVQEIEAFPDVSLLFYCPVEQIQLRLQATARLMDGEQARAHWDALSPSSRRTYLAVSGTGLELDGPGSGLPSHLEGRLPEAEEVEDGFSHFTVIETKCDQWEWLYLNRAGNRRACFQRQEAPNGAITWLGNWAVP